MSWKKGEAPWEKAGEKLAGAGQAFLAPSYKKGQAPWETQDELAPRPTEEIDFEKSAIEEMHPAISTADRAIVKNFANNPEAGVAYLKKQYPDLKIGNDGERYIISAPGDENNRVLDPNTGFISSDFPRDALDVGYDVASGVGETAAATAGAGAGLLAGGPPGALAGGAAAAGVTGAGADYGRQKIGQMLGIPQEVNKTSVATSGLLSGMTAGLLGTMPGKKAIEKFATKKIGEGLSKEAVQELIDRSGQGGIKKAYLSGTRTVGPKIAETVSGVPAEATRTLGNKFDELTDLNETGVTKLVENAQNKLVRGLGALKREKGEAIGNAIDSAGEKVNLVEAKKIFTDYIDELKGYEAELPTPALKEQIANAEEEFARIFGTTESPVADQVSARAGFKIQQDLKDVADLQRTKGGPMPRFAQNASTDEKILAEKGRGAYNILNDEFDRVTDGLTPEAKAEYAKLANLQKNLQPYFNSPERTMQTLSNLDSNSRKILYERLNKLAKEEGIDLTQDAKLLEAYKYYGKPSLDQLSTGGTTSTSRTIPLAIGGSTVGALAGYKLGGGYAGAAAGGALGGKLGTMAGSPNTIKNVVKYGRKAEKLGQGALKLGSKVQSKKATQAEIQTIWELMKDKEQD
jgi:hypothetical protein